MKTHKATFNFVADDDKLISIKSELASYLSDWFYYSYHGYPEKYFEKIFNVCVCDVADDTVGAVVQDKMSKLKQKYTISAAENMTLSAENEAMKNVMTALRNEITTLTARNELLQQEVSDLTDENTTLHEFSALANKISGSRKNVAVPAGIDYMSRFSDNKLL
jgi:regulator of replication initiation timing